MKAKWFKGKVFMSDEELKTRIIKLANLVEVEFINAEEGSECEAEFSDFYEALRRTLDILDEKKTIENRLKHLLQSDAVRLYDEFDPTISGGYTRDIAELDHLVFDSKCMPTAAEAVLVKRVTTNREMFLDETTNFELASMICRWKQPVLPCSYCAWTRNTCGLSSCLIGVMEWLSLRAVEGSEKRER